MFFNETETTEISTYGHTLALHDALPISNRIKPRPVVPARGIIYDRKGRILADNVPAFRLDVVPEDAGDPKALVAGLSKIIALSPEDIERFEQERKASRSFRAVTLKLRLSADERSEEHTSELQSLMRISYAVFGLKKKK